MATSLKSLRQGLGLDLAECTVATVTSAGATTITAATLVDNDASSSKYDRAWLKVTDGDAAGSVRRIRETDEDETVKGFDPANGILQWSRDLSDVPAPGDEFEIHQLLDPDRMDTLINRALQRCSHLEQEDITVVSGQREYSLAAYTWLTRQQQITQVWWRQGSTALKYKYHPLSWWEVFDDAGVLTLHIRPLAAEGDTIVLEGIAPYGALSADDEETDCPAEWVRAMARWEIYNWLVQSGAAQDVSRYEERRTEAYRDARRLYKLHAPRPRPRIQLPDSPARGYSSQVAH